jgi:hypothetical protein
MAPEANGVFRNIEQLIACGAARQFGQQNPAFPQSSERLGATDGMPQRSLLCHVADAEVA